MGQEVPTCSRSHRFNLGVSTAQVERCLPSSANSTKTWARWGELGGTQHSAFCSWCFQTAACTIAPCRRGRLCRSAVIAYWNSMVSALDSSKLFTSGCSGGWTVHWLSWGLPVSTGIPIPYHRAFSPWPPSCCLSFSAHLVLSGTAVFNPHCDWTTSGSLRYNYFLISSHQISPVSNNSLLLKMVSDYSCLEYQDPENGLFFQYSSPYSRISHEILPLTVRLPWTVGWFVLWRGLSEHPFGLLSLFIFYCQ